MKLKEISQHMPRILETIEVVNYSNEKIKISYKSPLYFNSMGNTEFCYSEDLIYLDEEQLEIALLLNVKVGYDSFEEITDGINKGKVIYYPINKDSIITHNNPCMLKYSIDPSYDYVENSEVSCLDIKEMIDKIQSTIDK